MPRPAHTMPLRRRSLAILLLVLASISLKAASPAAADDFTPTLEFSSYLGGSGFEFGEDITLDTAGNIYVTGETESPNFPASNPLNAATPGIFVTKFDPSGTTILYSTFLGNGSAIGIAVDAYGYAYVTGRATNLRTVNPIQATNAGLGDAFVAKLNPSGTALVYSTYLGGSGEDYALGIALDSAQDVYIVGVTNSTDFPVHNPFQASNAGQWDVFVMRLNSAGSALVYSTYYGGIYTDIGREITSDSAGNAYITGYTQSSDFPTQNAYQPNHGNGCVDPVAQHQDCRDAYMAKFSPAGIPLYSTFLGAEGNGDAGISVAVDSQYNVYVAGYTDSTNFPTVNAYQSTLLNTVSAFVTKFSADGSRLIYSTYLGGASDQSAATGIAIDSEGKVYLAGVTWETDFPTAHPVQPANAGPPLSSDVFISQFSADGSTLLFSTYLGGTDNDNQSDDTSPDLALDRQGNVYIIGTTHSSDFPIVSAFQGIPGGGAPSPSNIDAFFAKIAFPVLSLPDQAPKRNYFITHTPTLTWTPVTWAVHYRVQVDTTTAFAAPRDFEADGSASSLVTGSLPNGFYYWRVQAQKPDGQWSVWSSVDSFTIAVDD